MNRHRTVWQKRDEAIAVLGKTATLRDCINAGYLTEQECISMVEDHNGWLAHPVNKESSIMSGVIMGYLLGNTV